MILSHEQTDMHAGTTQAPDLVGREGVAQTLLRPSGMALLDGKRLDVVAESDMIERGSAIKVVAIDGTRVVVRKI
jgi:membrane-bound serine protease (ClpP class)